MIRTLRLVSTVLACAASALVLTTADPARADRSVRQAANGLPPQVLGLIATVQPLPLTCGDGACSAVLTSFCLQEDRPSPHHGQPYDLAGLGDVSLVVTKISGETVRFAATGLLAYTTEDDFTRMRVSMEESRLASLDATAVAIDVEPMVSLTPVLDRPLPPEVAARDEETALGAPRLLAESFFKPGTPRADAARALTRMIGLLPAGAASTGSATKAIRDGVWDKVRAGGGLDALSRDGVSRAKSELDRCGAYADMGVRLTLRGCLETSHGKTLREVNEDFWKHDPAGY